ncbi:hypothetical protein OS493_036216 [Desmophyllum pertusum]|uniref:Uncharacterized protein n=1 Tax=Desmophyllum pertusum TaxID=174260 RepID=A0A9X0CC96_9CNID|nr:hypothetical protein OS493_036216 [Desmophyllum pertusum]
MFSMDDTNEPSQDPTGADIKLNSERQFLQDEVVDMKTADSALPSMREMLDVISESAELAQNLQALMLTSPCSTNTSDDSTVTNNSAESKAKQEPESTDSTLEPPGHVVNSSSQSRTTTTILCYDENFQALNISLQHRDSIEFNVDAKNGEHVFALEADGDADVAGLSTRRKRKKHQPQREKSTTNVEPGKRIKTEWRFPMSLSDFTDSENLDNDIGHWLANLISSLLSEAQDLDDFESVIKLLDEAMKLRESSIPDCIKKLAKAIQCMSTLVGNEDSIIRYNVLLTETQFALAEFYTKEGDYLAALHCLKTLESSLTLYQEAQKSRLYAKFAKVMENCLEFSVDFTSHEIEIEGASNAPISNGNPSEVVLCYFQKALNFSNKEPSATKREIIQRCCYLGRAAVLMKCWKKQTENVKDLTEARENLSSTERLFDRISPAMQCQFHLTEAFLFYYDGRYQMATYKAQAAHKIADKEHFLERKCLGSKRLHFLLAELDKNRTSYTVKHEEEALDI